MEIINLLSEELKHNDVLEDVRKADRTYTGKFQANNVLGCRCEQIKPQILAAQNEFSSAKAMTEIISGEFKYMKQTTNNNMHFTISSPNVTSSKSSAFTVPISAHSKPRTANNNYYAISTKNRFDILSNFQDLQCNDLVCSFERDCTTRSLPKTRSTLDGSSDRKILHRRNTTSTPLFHTSIIQSHQKIVKEEAATSFIPTTVNGVTSATTNQESVWI